MADHDVRMTQKAYNKLVASIKHTAALAHIRTDVDREAIQHMHKELQELRERMAEVETRGVRYRGTFQAADQYTRGDMATYAGAIWHANCTTRSRPGTDSSWTLAVKSP